MSRFVSETGRYAWGIGTRGDGQRGGFRSGSYRSGSYRSGSNRPGSNRPGSYINVMDNSRPLALNDYPKGPTLAEWGSSELMPEEDGNSENLTKTNYELLASYNWLPLDRKEGEAAMVVPGLPARWTPPPLPAWLNPDTGLYFIDQNAYRNPASPLEPALLALFTLQPTFDPNPIDIIADRNNLRKLLRFVRANKQRKFLRDFKMYVEVVNKTVLLTRWEKETSQLIAENQFGGYGHSFERDFTKHTKGLEGSSAHKRLSRYSFGGLNIMVRFSADAFLSSKTITSPTAATIPQNDRHSPQAQGCTKNTGGNGTKVELGTNGGRPTPMKVQSTLLDTDDLAALLSTTLTLEKSPKPIPQPAPKVPNTPELQHKIQVITGGMLMPQHRVVEIKTRAEKRGIDLTDQIPQLWFSDTSNLYIGYHQNGSITNVDTGVMDAKALAVWEAQEENQADLAKLKVLLHKIVNVARNTEGGKGQLVAVGGKMKFHSIAEGEVAIGTLPLYLRNKWDFRTGSA